MCRGDVSMSPWRFQEDTSSWLLFCSKNNLWCFGFPCLMRWGSQPGVCCLLIFYVVIIRTPFRPQLRPLDRKWSPRDCSCGHLWGGKGEVCRQATLTKIILLKALILAVWTNHWKTAMVSILRFRVPYVALLLLILLCSVENREEDNGSLNRAVSL